MHPCPFRLNSKLILFFLFFSSNLIGQITIVNKNKELEKKLNIYLQKSDSCKVKFDYSNSFKYISEVLSYAKENKDVNVEILCNIKLVELYRHATIFVKAELYLHRTENLIRYNKAKVSDFNKMYFYNRKAALFSEFYHKPDSTLYYSKKALTLARKLHNSNFEFTSLMEIGYYYEQVKDLKNALKYYQTAFELAKKNSKKSACCDALINLSRVYEKSKNYKEALEKCNEGLAIINNDDNFFQKLLFYDIKHNIYENLGDKSAAYDNLKLRLKYADLYYEKNAQDKLLEENKKFEILEKDKVILQRNKDIEEVKRNQILLIAIILLFVLGIISLLYYSKKIRIANKQLDFYSKENAFLLKEANHRINNNLQLIIVLLNEELDKIEDSDSDNSSIKKILIKIESISTLHRHLYQSNDKNTVDIKEYLSEILINFEDFFSKKEVVVKYDLEKINIPIDMAMYLGLLTTELFINSIKYAFNNQSSRLISLKVNQNESVLHFDYTDNGEQSIGKEITPKLVTTICKQIKADYKIETLSGFEFYLTKKL